MNEQEIESVLHCVYVIQIAPEWVKLVRPSLEEGSELLYVGQSQHRPKKRFGQHRRGHGFATKGGEAAARPFQKIRAAREERGLEGTLEDEEDAWLRRDLMKGLEPVTGKAAGEDLELKTAELLRSRSHKVIGPRPPKRERRERREAK